MDPCAEEYSRRGDLGRSTEQEYTLKSAGKEAKQGRRLSSEKLMVGCDGGLAQQGTGEERIYVGKRAKSEEESQVVEIQGKI